jgi:hypothetical protein
MRQTHEIKRQLATFGYDPVGGTQSHSGVCLRDGTKPPVEVVDVGSTEHRFYVRSDVIHLTSTDPSVALAVINGLSGVVVERNNIINIGGLKIKLIKGGKTGFHLGLHFRNVRDAESFLKAPIFQKIQRVDLCGRSKDKGHLVCISVPTTLEVNDALIVEVTIGGTFARTHLQ